MMRFEHMLRTMSVILAAGVLVAAAQTEATKLDMIRLSNGISKRAGVVALVVIRPRDQVYDIEVRFGAPVKSYRAAMGAVVATVGDASKSASYKTEWCYIVTHERGRERILVSDIRQTQTLALDGKRDEAWTYFDGKKAPVK